ncbi:uncharacterized protein BP5553_10558 [Venustampulla echinocandica]|uniref:Uncharacterized protein n=1 Tax=Venustampulla echinocandica TaxID=2656787 RepID=A0A370T8X2_9HELO|nr:uncharacterized protein BP5553_10558 [Venustampulla echinocandica]RDL29931.1 hypothetical protein BP5553_10558 [Venustampulla echinocandica]
MLDLSRLKKGFFASLIDYFITIGLMNLLGLRVLIDGMDQAMQEATLDQGTAMLNAAVVRGCSPTGATGWRIEVRDGQPCVCQANETHAEMTWGNYSVFNSGKPKPKLSDADDLKKALVDVDVLGFFCGCPQRDSVMGSLYLMFIPDVSINVAKTYTRTLSKERKTAEESYPATSDMSVLR